MTSATPMAARILDAGLDLIEEGGPQHLTMRRLGDRLGITATALYHHFSGRAEILDAVAERLCATVTDGFGRHGSWVERVHPALVGWMARAAAHPRATSWTMTEYAQRLPVLRIHEVLLATLRDSGFGPEEMLLTKGVLMRYCVGHLVLPELAPGGAWQTEVDPEVLPTMRWAETTSHPDRSVVFAVGLAALLAGLDASDLAPRSPVTR